MDCEQLVWRKILYKRSLRLRRGELGVLGYSNGDGRDQDVDVMNEE